MSADPSLYTPLNNDYTDPNLSISSINPRDDSLSIPLVFAIVGGSITALFLTWALIEATSRFRAGLIQFTRYRLGFSSKRRPPSFYLDESESQAPSLEDFHDKERLWSFRFDPEIPSYRLSLDRPPSASIIVTYSINDSSSEGIPRRSPHSGMFAVDSPSILYTYYQDLSPLPPKPPEINPYNAVLYPIDSSKEDVTGVSFPAKVLIPDKPSRIIAQDHPFRVRPLMI